MVCISRDLLSSGTAQNPLCSTCRHIADYDDLGRLRIRCKKSVLYAQCKMNVLMFALVVQGALPPPDLGRST
jgi:hypothetical protein